MSQVSRRWLKENIKVKIDQLFLESISCCSTPEELSPFLEDLLTPTEKVMLSKRLAIAYLLQKGIPYPVINQLLKVSNPTIRSVSYVLMYKGTGLRTALEKVTKRKQLKTFFQELGDIAIDIFGKSKGSNWRATNATLHARRRERQSLL